MTQHQQELEMHQGKLRLMALWMLGFVLLVPSVSTAQVSQKAKDYNKKYQMEKEEAQDKAECMRTVKRCERHITEFTGESRTYMAKKCKAIKGVCEECPIPITSSKALKTHKDRALSTSSKELCNQVVQECISYAEQNFTGGNRGWLQRVCPKIITPECDKKPSVPSSVSTIESFSLAFFSVTIGGHRVIDNGKPSAPAIIDAAKEMTDPVGDFAQRLTEKALKITKLPNRIKISHKGKSIEIGANGKITGKINNEEFLYVDKPNDKAFIKVGGMKVQTGKLRKRLIQAGCVIKSGGNVYMCAPDVIEREAAKIEINEFKEAMTQKTIDILKLPDRIKISHKGKSIELGANGKITGKINNEEFLYIDKSSNKAFVKIKGIRIQTGKLRTRLTQAKCLVDTGGDIYSCAPDVIDREVNKLKNKAINKVINSIRQKDEVKYVNIGSISEKEPTTKIVMQTKTPSGSIKYFAFMMYDGPKHDRALTVRIKTNGNLGGIAYDHEWTNGWDTAEAYIINDISYLMIGKSKGRRARIYKLQPNGRLIKVGEEMELVKGWDIYDAYKEDNGKQHIALINTKKGTIRIQEVRSSGRLGRVVCDTRHEELRLPPCVSK